MQSDATLIPIRSERQGGCRIPEEGGIMWKILMFTISISLLLLCSCGGTEPPVELYGEWITSNQRYQDCRIVIQQDAITFMNGLDYISFNDIEKIQDVTPKNSHRSLYKIFYEDKENNEFSLEIYFYETEEGPTIQFKHQKKLIWTKAQAS